MEFGPRSNEIFMSRIDIKVAIKLFIRIGGFVFVHWTGNLEMIYELNPRGIIYYFTSGFIVKAMGNNSNTPFSCPNCALEGATSNGT